jgi:type IV secretory pathway VirB4 component
MLALKQFRDKAPGLPDLLNWAGLFSAGVVGCKDGSLVAGFFFEGPDLDASPDTRLNWVSERVNAALAHLGGGWAIWVDAVRMPSPTYFRRGDSHFPDPISEMIDNERRAHFSEIGRHYETEYALLIHYTPPIRSKGMLIDLIYEGGSEEDQSPASAILAAFERVLMEIEDSLSGVLRLRRMREVTEYDITGKPQRRSHLVNYLHFTVTGQELSLNLPASGFYLDTVIGGQECYPGDTPLIGQSYVALAAGGWTTAGKSRPSWGWRWRTDHMWTGAVIGSARHTNHRTVVRIS